MTFECVKKHPICLASLFVVVCSACTPVENSKESIREPSANAVSVSTTETITAANAPTRITRNFRTDKDGNLLIAAFDDIIRFDGQSFTKLSKPEGVESFSAFDALQDRSGNIWVASRRLGVFRYDGQTFTHFTVRDGLADNTTISIYEDKAGRIWAATQGGLSFYQPEPSTEGQIRFQSFTTEDGLTSNEVNAVLEDRTGKLWIGTRGALAIYDASASPGISPFTEVTDSFSKPFINVWSIIEDQSGSIWLADERGLWRYRDNVFTYYEASAKVARLHEDRNGNIWFIHNSGGTQKNGLSYFEHASLQSDNPKATQVHTSDDMLFGLSEDKDGHIWVGTLKGVFRVIRESGDLSVTNFEDGLKKN